MPSSPLPVASLLDVLFETLKHSRHTIDQVNAACQSHGLPLAFPDHDGTPEIPGSPDYRFEGFGVIISLPPRLSFYVHYKPGSPQHIALGQFTVAIGSGNLKILNRLLEEATDSLGI